MEKWDDCARNRDAQTAKFVEDMSRWAHLQSAYKIGTQQGIAPPPHNSIPGLHLSRHSNPLTL